ncbi:MAG: glycine cleavage system protein H [Deltaproteobacteria bacterium]|jgi:glycine cleavage system H lipoate-binding protein|nr:glycine cleavage system protein H [Deltaproteobacteria bacterium]
MRKEDKKKLAHKKEVVVGFNVLEKECIWMKAGVVNFRLCDNAYDCNSCLFDKGMRKALSSRGKEGEKGISLANLLKNEKRDGSSPCRHALTGRTVASKICPFNYECYHCPYDQWLDDYDQMEYKPALSHTLASGFKLAQGYYYHPGHAWVRFEHGGRIRVGFDDFLVKLFGPLDALELPRLGASLEQDQIGWKFSRNSKKAFVRSPVSGAVLTVNYRTQDHPDIAHKDPYNEGWLFILEPDKPKKNLKELYFGSNSVEWMEEESKKLLELIGPEYKRLAAIGGEPIDDVYGSIPELGWNLLVETFLVKQNPNQSNNASFGTSGMMNAKKILKALLPP